MGGVHQQLALPLPPTTGTLALLKLRSRTFSCAPYSLILCSSHLGCSSAPGPSPARRYLCSPPQPLGLAACLVGYGSMVPMQQTLTQSVHFVASTCMKITNPMLGHPDSMSSCCPNKHIRANMYGPQVVCVSSRSSVQLGLPQHTICACEAATPWNHQVSSQGQGGAAQGLLSRVHQQRVKAWLSLHALACGRHNNGSRPHATARSKRMAQPGLQLFRCSSEWCSAALPYCLEYTRALLQSVQLPGTAMDIRVAWQQNPIGVLQTQMILLLSNTSSQDYHNGGKGLGGEGVARERREKGDCQPMAWYVAIVGTLKGEIDGKFGPSMIVRHRTSGVALGKLTSAAIPSFYVPPPGCRCRAVLAAPPMTPPLPLLPPWTP
ncbi:hypothetical protein HaLaN_24593 [Haematococcus lacustris]|uniref:Uncharacterized protein n=1 Tax=Haematococcus lacustris TaxID=44745 RepID=A0A6A0A327_HAELA|nr:hypothetical protein HaLaN_24593 [Haematococcus lacustris]